MCDYRRLFFVLIVLTVFMSGCVNNSAQENHANTTISTVYEEGKSAVESIVIEDDSNSEEHIETENSKSDNENAVVEYVDEVSAVEYYQDYYFHEKYLIIESCAITSYVCLEGYTSVESVRYDDIVRVEVDYLDNLGFIEITDIAGGLFSFVFESSTAKEAEQMIDSYR